MKRKDKNEEQRVQKEEIKAKLKQKKHGKAVVLEHHEPSKTERKKVLIVCGGRNTEMDYFNHFKNRFRSACTKVTCRYEEKSPLQVVESAKKRKAGYDEVWAVFDKDEFEDFDEAIQEGEKSEIGIAYSNQAFEYWLLLHFEAHQGEGMHRDTYKGRLEKHFPYDENKKIKQKAFEKLMGSNDINLKNAIKRAESIYKNHAPHKQPSTEESSTTVFRLVQSLCPELKKT